MYDSCKYDDSNIVDVRNANKENKITFVNKFDDNNNVYDRNVNKVLLWIITKSLLMRRRCCVRLRKQSKYERLVSLGVVSRCIIVAEVASWKGGSNIRFSVKQ